jgi:Chorismate synthase
MGMRIGDSVRVTLFGESHGKCVGALVEGIPAGTEIDLQGIEDKILREESLEEKVSVCVPNPRNARFFRESMKGRQQVGLLLCLLGISMLNRRITVSFLINLVPDMLTFLKWSVQMVQPTCVEEALNRLD